MALNPNQIRVAGIGRVYVAPKGTPGPADTTGPWPAPSGTAPGWVELGFTTPEGVKLVKKDKFEPVDVWQLITPARYVYKDMTVTLKFSLLQINATTLPFFLGGGAVSSASTGSGTSATTTYQYAMPSVPKPDERALGIEFVDGPDQATSVTYRIIVPRGMVTENDEVGLTRTSALKLGVTFSVMASDDKTPLLTVLSNDASLASAS